ncbi:MAG: SIMPL domain-containing protein [Panacagrimonas sp.]
MKHKPWLMALLVWVFSAPLAAAEQVAPRLVSVTGEGQTSVVPDRARLQMGVTRVESDVTSAEKQVNQTVRDYVAALRAMGIGEQHISTAGISVQPEYRWVEPERKRQLQGYRVSRRIQITLEDLSKLGNAILLATKAGVNQIQGPVLESSRAQQLEQQALNKAAEDAQAQARLLAEKLGAKLGPVRQIRTAQSPHQPPPRAMMMRAEMASDGGNQEMGMATGLIRFATQVHVEFDLIAP